jgi:excisionase family DNA binding protein
MTALASGVIVTTPEQLSAIVRDAVADALAERAPSPEPTGLLSTPEVARRLGVSRATAHRMANEGLLPFIWCGDSRRFDLAECIATLKQRGRK